MKYFSSRRWLGLLLVAVLGVVGFGFFGQNWGYVWQCSQLLSDQNWPELARIAENWSHQQPECGAAWWYRAQVAIHAAHWKEAAESLERIREDDPQALVGRSQLADLQLNELNRPQDAAETDLSLLKRFPRRAESRDRLVRFFAMTFRRAELIQQARESIRLGCDRPLTYFYLVGANFLYDLDHYVMNSQWLKADPENEQYQVVRSLWVSHSKLDTIPQEASRYAHVPKLADLFKRYPQNVELLRYQAEEALLDGDATQVGQALSRMPSTAENEASFWLIHSWLQIAAGDLDAADTEARYALKLDPFYWRTSHQLAEINRQRGVSGDAIHADQLRRWEEIAKSGLELEEVMNYRQATVKYREGLLRKILAYVELCGELDIARKMRKRLDDSRL